VSAVAEVFVDAPLSAWEHDRMSVEGELAPNRIALDRADIAARFGSC
jgi:hypothetical protein